MLYRGGHGEQFVHKGSSGSAGAPGGPAISQAHVEEPVARGTVRPIGPLVGAPPITLVVTLAGGT